MHNRIAFASVFVRPQLPAVDGTLAEVIETARQRVAAYQRQQAEAVS